MAEKRELRDRKGFAAAEPGLMSGLKKPVVAGTIVLTPFVANFFVLKWFFSFFQSLPGSSLFNLTAFPILNSILKGSAFTVLAGIAVLSVGKIISTRKGVALEEKIDVFFTGLPVVGAVYTITKTATDTVLRKTEDFQHPVKLKIQGLKVTGFQTGKCSQDGKKMVFVPTSPNITSGFVVEVDEDRIEETGESLEDAFTRVLSAGFSS